MKWDVHIFEFVATLFLKSGEKFFRLFQKFVQQTSKYFESYAKWFIKTVRLLSTIISVNILSRFCWTACNKVQLNKPFKINLLIFFQLSNSKRV